ncbi:MAG: PAS domain S-box protein [Burkholderiaceae bacterium]
MSARATTPSASASCLAEAVVQAVAVPCVLLLDDSVVGANEALCRLASRDPAELPGRRFLDLVEPDSRPQLQTALQDCAQHGEQPPVILSSIVTPDGGLRPVEIHARRVGLEGETAQVLVTCVDLSDVMHVQNSLLDMTKMLSQIIDGASVPSLVIDRQHRITHWNTACERLTGIKRNEVIGSRDGWKAFYREKRPLLADMIVDGTDQATLQSFYGSNVNPSSAIAGGVEVESFFPLLGPEGKWLFFTAAPLYDAQCQVIGAIETLQDVTARRASEEALLRHRNELEEMVRQRSAELSATARSLEMFILNSPIGVAYTSGGLIQKLNPAMAAMFGYDDSEMVGLPARSVYLSPEDYSRMGRQAGPLLAQGEPIHCEMWLRHASGRAIWTQIDAYVANTNDPANGIWWMMQDRSEIREAQEQLQIRINELNAMNQQLEDAQNQLLQQDKMASIGQLAAGVAHEINNPIGFVSSNLHTLRGYLGGLLDLSAACDAVVAAPEDPATIRALSTKRDDIEIDFLREDLPVLLDECAEGLSRVKKIVQDLKDFSRVDHSDWQEADLNAGLESTLNVVRHEVKYKAEVVKALSPLPPVNCLSAQLNQVFMNLVVNAAQAIDEKGTITLASGSEGDWVWVQIEDTGSGMSAEVQRRIFEPFFTTKGIGRGTGLGLSLSFSIVQKHGGTIQVHSREGHGTAMRVWIPIAGPQSMPGDAKPPRWEHGFATQP